MKRMLAFGCCSLIIAACGGKMDGEAPTLSDPITGGQVDSSRPAVGALVSPTTLQIFCSGTLISTSPPRFLTAAHCVTGKTPSAMKVAFGPSESQWQSVVAVTRIAVHPDYDPSFAALRPSDIAYVDLAEAPVTSAGPVVPIAANGENLGPGRVGESWLFMGYGADHQAFVKKVGKTWTGYGIKRSVSIPISTISDGRGEFDYYAYDTDGNSSTEAANTCYGDSGGPALASDSLGQQVVTGVTSRGNADCGAVGALGIDTRVDTFYSFVTEPAPACGDATCSGGETCQSCEADCGACPTGGQCSSCSSDADCTSGARCFRLTTESAPACHMTCGTSADCPSGLSCGRVTSGYGKRCLACP